MLQSKLCPLSKMNRKQLMSAGEEPVEKGGYFICKGSEKVIILFTIFHEMQFVQVIRLLIANRRNFPIALVRKTFKNKVLSLS